MRSDERKEDTNDKTRNGKKYEERQDEEQRQDETQRRKVRGTTLKKNDKTSSDKLINDKTRSNP